MASNSATSLAPDATSASNDVAVSIEKLHFTEKEDRVLKAAWLCLASGPPEVDMEKLTKLAGFNTKKTCANTWGVIKKKLMTMAPPTGEGEMGEEIVMQKTPKTPNKRGKQADAGVPDEDGSPKKKRKSPTKKEAVPALIKKEADDTEEEAGEGENIENVAKVA